MDPGHSECRDGSASVRVRVRSFVGHVRCFPPRCVPEREEDEVDRESPKDQNQHEPTIYHYITYIYNYICQTAQCGAPDWCPAAMLGALVKAILLKMDSMNGLVALCLAFFA